MLFFYSHKRIFGHMLRNHNKMVSGQAIRIKPLNTFVPSAVQITETFPGFNFWLILTIKEF